MIDLAQLRRFVVRPALEVLQLGGVSAENLVLGTALAESGCRWLHQVGGGPAIGLWQCEPATHDDLWVWIAYHTDLAAAVRSLMTPQKRLDQLASNLAYAAAICRLHYRRVPAELPAAGDAAALSAYHKRWYNTPAGAADPVRNTPLFQQAIAAG
jgi:hypothetical protein